MPYIKPVYVAYDGANDLEHYKEMQEWTQSDGSKFNFYDGLDLSKKIDKLPDEEVKN